MRWVFAVVCWLPGPLVLPAQQYHLRDGRVLPAEQVAVRGVFLVEAMDEPGAGTTVEQSYPLSDVIRLDWPEPAALAEGRQALARGRPGDAVAAVEPIRSEFVLFAKVPGSWWTAASVLRLRGLLNAGAMKEAELAARELIATAIDPEALGLAGLALAELALAAREVRIASALVEAVLAGDVPSAVEARASLVQGEQALLEGNPEAALDSFLRVIVLHGSHRDLLAPALEGSRRAYELLGDVARAQRAASQLGREFPELPQAARSGLAPLPASPSS